MENLTVRCKKLHPDAVVPKYSKEGDAGLDLTAVDMTVTEDGLLGYNIGLAIEIPKGFVGLIYPRSSIKDKDLQLTNSVGVIDSGYRGPIKAFFRPTRPMHDSSFRRYKPGDRICQVIIVPYPSIVLEDVVNEELEDSFRGAGGFGSTGS